jgi:hypothetical protein
VVIRSAQLEGEFKPKIQEGNNHVMSTIQNKEEKWFECIFPKSEWQCRCTNLDKLYNCDSIYKLLFNYS